MKDHASRAMRQLKLSGADAVPFEDPREDPVIPLRHFNILADVVPDYFQGILTKYKLHAVQIDDGIWGVYDVATAEEIERFTDDLADAKLAPQSYDDKFDDIRARHDEGEQGDIPQESSTIEDQTADELNEEDETPVD